MDQKVTFNPLLYTFCLSFMKSVEISLKDTKYV